MRFLFLILLLSFDSMACQNLIPISEARKAIALEPHAGSKTCKDLPDEDCLCFDGIDWETAKISFKDGTSHKIFTVDHEKVAAKESRESLEEITRQVRKAKKEAAKNELKSVDWSQVTTIAKLKAVLKSVVDKLEDE